MNQPAQKRSGNNMGVSPVPGNGGIYQQNSALPFYLLGNKDTVLWEGKDDRCPRAVGGIQPKFVGFLVTTDTGSADTVDGDLVFVDDEDNEITIGAFSFTLADGVAPLLADANINPGVNGFILCKGEKVLARVTSATKPTGRVQAIAPSVDLKTKGAGKGGLSDGGVICIRRDVSTEVGVIEPFPGETWEEGFLDSALALSWFYANNALTAADIQWGWQDLDGTNYWLDVLSFDTADPEAVTSSDQTNNTANTVATRISSGRKLIFRFNPGSVIPAKRVQIMGVMSRLDTTPDLDQE